MRPPREETVATPTNTPLVPRRLTFLLACALGVLMLAAAAAGQDAHREKRIIDARIDNLEEKIDAARSKEGVLSAQIEQVTAKIRALEDDVAAAESRLDSLESVLALHQRKLDRLNELYRLQTKRLLFLQGQHKVAQERLNKRLVEIYTADRLETLTVVLSAANFSDMLDQLEYLNDIGRQDERVAQEVAQAKSEMQETRNATRKTRRQVAETTRAVAARTAEQRAVRDRLAWSQRELATARRDKEQALESTQIAKEDYLREVEGLLAQSSALAAKIQAAQAAAAAAAAAAPASAPAPAAARSSSGFIWPVQGVLTSPFGWRWGRMHEGIDIAVGNGTPVVASASGTVIVAGWMGGYGNLVVVDHGNGVSTAYAHNTSVVVGIGQTVAQGQLVAYSGNTGNSTGPHVHFEVRVNGAAVDPLGYL
ncbi:MAG TPA: peptidoglycan DD-metalloendopeptidase family protein [Gaiellaceae bacterium]|nr:peptidoglycan DD-metalloendopeptidase family protein [Gaiellaceae bacterium]